MTPMQIAAFRAHAMSSGYARRLAEAREIVSQIDPSRAYVGFSAGKDSSVIAHMCAEMHPGIAILMVDPGVPTHWTGRDRQTWMEWIADAGWNFHKFDWDKWGVVDASGSVEDYQKKIHSDMFSSMYEWADARGLFDRVQGLRAEESRVRRILLRKRGAVYEYACGGRRSFLPIARWTTMDVWAYIVTSGMPWLDIYDAMGPGARNGLIGRSGEEYGRAEFLQMHYPDVWRLARSKGIL